MKITDISGTVKLNNSVSMPYLGLGVYKAKNGNEISNAIHHALRIGYRAIDTAAMYLNEEGVGKAVNSSGLPRGHIFITSKVWNSDHGYDRTIKAFHRSLNELKFTYLDLYLIHWPVRNKYNQTWKALETLYEEGKIKAIGVSNFLQHQMEDVLGSCKITPAINQMEFHPKLVQQELIDFCKNQNIKYQAWSPLMQGDLSDERLNHIADKYNKTVAQIILRWDLQKGVLTIPKSTHPNRISENADIFDFELSVEDVEKINGLNKNQRLGPDPAQF